MTFKANEAAFAAAKYTLYSIPVLETVLTNITELAAVTEQSDFVERAKSTIIAAGGLETFKPQCVASDRYKKERLCHPTIPVLDTAVQCPSSQIAHSLHPSSFKLNQESESPQTCKVPMRFYARFKPEIYKKFEAAIMDPGPWIAVAATWPREARTRLTTTNPPFVV
ncbi:hypothetical protein EV421DRAFT_1904313 [Armillaria borealis]|uniref:Uncharacterized protein n=1 Tax=Armillaria borealis TaxID=47425 RepID=A0AA39JHZ5_9AGAR|nr:hypothetical protein EV421DRAFT_1904313 [Armillaria borealis]